MRDEYQNLLDTGQYTPETIAQWEDRALAWLDRVGDTGKAIDMIEDGMEPAGKVGTMVRRLVMESPEFAALPEGRRRAIELRNVLKGTEWGREGVARRLPASRWTASPRSAPSSTPYGEHHRQPGQSRLRAGAQAAGRDRRRDRPRCAGRF